MWCENRVSHSGVAEESIILGYYTVSVVTIIWETVMPSPSG